ncbi:phosphoglycerate dehydrogenase [Tepidimicrobium xylanilyticum]|uniref:Phosphoglycerate dehydrogenase n=1 Tax=Tepidimicrobium xylanilyticum TaxID=1123352 RepID=A0A1H2XJW1_9FIRM|nr:phosphoglycerate dehydrogenase [Tepidimicrobium xylanilyticum]SDW92988.1 Phosphoglycerate dehydrogenase [Tepidimicrobium xylanilyticum]
MKALITFKYTDEEFKTLKELGYEIIFQDEKDLTFSDDIKDAEVLVCFDPFKKLDIDMLPKLKWIQLLSAGINQVPVDKVLKRNIILTNNRGGYSIPIAEWIVLKTLEMYKNSWEFYKKQENKEWKVDTSLFEIYGETIGFVGTGSIAQEAAKRFEGFGVNIVGVNATGKKAEYFHECYSTNRLNEVVSKWDVLVVAAPYTDKTHHLINEEVFKNIKDGTYLINIARGSIIDEKALIENLKSGKIRKAALDVFEAEPLPKDSPLWDMDNVIISPHNSWASEMNAKRRYEIAYKNMKKYINSEKLINVIDIKKGY